MVFENSHKFRKLRHNFWHAATIVATSSRIVYLSTQQTHKIALPHIIIADNPDNAFSRFNAMDWDRASVACLLHSCCIFIHCWATSLPNLPINYPGIPSDWQSSVCHSQHAHPRTSSPSHSKQPCESVSQLGKFCVVKHKKCVSLRLSLPNKPGLMNSAGWVKHSRVYIRWPRRPRMASTLQT